MTDGIRVVNQWQVPALIPERQHDLLQEALAKAWRAPFYAHKFEAAGLARGRSVPVPEWWRVPLTTKDELRQLETAAFYRDVCIAPQHEVADYWRSGGVTGKPIFYPRTHQDMLAGIETFRRALAMCGVRPGDLVANSMPFGVHPIGRTMTLAILSHGAGVLGTGAGSNTPTEQQAELFPLLNVDVLVAMGTYALHLANTAGQLGIDLAAARVRTVMSAADLITPAKRSRLERLWGAEVWDFYGVSEAGVICCECERHDGMHLFSDLFYLEVVDEETGAPVAEGEPGVLAVTPLYTNNATPFVRWVTGDLVTVRHGCTCTGPYRHLPVMRLAGRTSGFFKIRGVNINHRELEDLLLATPELADYRVTALLQDDREVLQIEVEPTSGHAPDAAVAQTARAVERVFALPPRVVAVPPGQIAGELQGQIKQTRIFDRRYSS